MEQDTPPPPPPCTSSAGAAAAVTGLGDPSSSLADTLRSLMSSARPELHFPPSPLPPPLPPQRPTTTSPSGAAAAGVGDPSSSSSAPGLRCLASSAEPELIHSSPSLIPPPPSRLLSTQLASASASSSAVPSYQQRLNQQFTTPDVLFGQSNNLFRVAPSASSQQYSSFLSSPGTGTMGNTLFPHLGAPAAATPLAMTHLSLLGGQQQQALPRPMTPGMLLLRQSDSFCGFGRQPMLDQGSSSRSAGLPPSRTETKPTFGSVQPSSDELVRLPPSMQMPPPRQEAGFTLPGTNVTRSLSLMGPFEATPQGQPLPAGSSSSSNWEGRLQLGGGAHTLSAWSTSGSVSNNGQSSAAIMSTGPWHCRNLSGESSTMSSMLLRPPPSVGDKGSLGPPPSKGRNRRVDTFTDAEMEKIRKEKRLSDLVITDPRRVKTILCNRASAKKSAERRESHRKGLQQQLQALDIEYTQLHGQAILQQEKLTELESQTSKLRMRLQDLDNELNLKEAINETLVSSIQSITLADSNARSGLPQQTSFNGQCSNGGQYQHMRNNPRMSSQMVRMQQLPEIQEEPSQLQQDQEAKQPPENDQFQSKDQWWNWNF